MKQNSSFNNSNNNKLLVLIVESGEKTSHAVVGDRLLSLYVKCIVNISSFRCYDRQWNGKGVNTFFFVCVFSAQYGLFMSR